MRTLITSALLFAAACAEPVVVTPQSSPPVRLGDALAYFDRATASVVVVDPRGQAGKAHDRSLVRVRVGEDPVLALSAENPDAPGNARLLVLDPAGEQLFVLDDTSGSKQVVQLGVPLERLAVAPSGAWAIAYDPGAGSPSSGLFSLPNTVAIVRLGGVPTAQALRLGTPGARPADVAFAVSTDLAVQVGAQATTVSLSLALVFVGGGVIPLDLSTATAGPFVPLAADDERDVVPAEVLFVNNEGDERRGELDGLERAFVRTTAGELFVLAISVDPESVLADPAHPAPRVSLENVVTPGSPVADAELFFDADGRELLLACAGRALILVDGYSGVAREFTQELSTDTLRRFVDPDTGRAMAVAYDARSPSRTLLRLDPLALSQRRASGVETLRLAAAVQSVDVTQPSARALIHYAGGTELGVLDLARGGDVLDLRFARLPTAMALAPAGGALWLVSESPKDGESHLAEVELTALGTREVRIDAPARTVGALGEWLYVDHADGLGAVTFFPKDALLRERGVTFDGVLLADLLSQDPSEGERP